MHGGHRQRNPLGAHPLPTNFVDTRHHPPAIPRSLLSTSSLRPQDTPSYDRRPPYQSNWDRNNNNNNNSDSREQRGNGPFSSPSTTPTRPAPLAATDDGVPPAKRLRVHTTTVHENSSSSSNYYARSDITVNSSSKRRYDDATYDPRRDPSPKRQFVNPNPPPNHRPTPDSPVLPPRSHYQHSSEKHHQNPSHHASQSVRHLGYGRGRRSRSRSRSWSRKRSRSTTSEDESTSEGESESEEDDIMVARESMLMNPLRTQGEIHDLLISLERNRTRYARATDRVKAISRTIQRTSRRLERKVRILAENMVAPPLPSPTVPKPDYMPVVAPNPSPPTTQRTLPQLEPEISTRERERERVQPPKPTTSVLAATMPQTSKRSVPLPPQRKPSSNGAVTITSTSTSSSVAAMRIDTVATAPRRDSSSSSASTSSTLSSIPSPTTPKQSSRHGPRSSVSSSIPVAQLDTCDVLFSPIKYVKTKAFTRKPRSLLFNVSKNSGSLMSDLMTTSSLDG
ncbi:hypothetical protein BC938DRAFT_479704 [Jimgerdemannia flammicorona]|uniref:Uncharacterized protein n=1 Tax=Jimgerdemannia flammicorona TaxID=994334 RepID=A0A433QXQ4_9FUNG|nr:hypothetical protein BC938DRAFT_479704 [Jimgerdemannia flammicorona]RUS34558.1 hypothetical protein BC938DRAFT_479704 [Jimgerdemannia flammicorona]